MSDHPNDIDEAGNQTGTRCGFVALLGAPNAGKSTLLNTLVGAKVAIVTHKVQTTRTLIRGICMAGSSQIVFIDTPGIFAPRRRLDRAMVSAAWTGAADADIVALLVDATAGITEDVERILERVGDVARTRLLVLNKIDKVKKSELLNLAAEISARSPFDETFMISALEGDGVSDLRDYLANAVPPGPWHYPPDDISDVPMRAMAAEITREKIFLRLHQELPYAVTVETTDWKDRKDGAVRIEQTIFVTRDNHRMIVLGKGGRTIKAISMEARKELAELMEQPVHLFLFVKVRERWQDDPTYYRDQGLEFPDS